MRRFFLFLSAIVMATTMVVGQNYAQYNSFCIYDNAYDASLYTCSSVDSITFEQHDGAICQVVWREGKRIVSPVSTVDSISFYNPYVEGIVEISEGFDIWDKAYVTPIGYFSYKSALVADGEDLDSEQYETLAYANFEDTQAATLILSKNDSLPVWFLVDSLTCTLGYFPEDSLCQVTIGCDSTVVCELEFHYNDSIVTIPNQYTDHGLKRCLWIVTSLLEGNTADCQAVTDVVTKFKTLLTVGEEDAEPKLPKKPISKKLKIKTDVYYGVGAGTYGAYYITSSSAVLQGCVYCASGQRDSASEYGILCDENPENLTIEKARYNLVGHQERMRLRYEVRVTGLKPNTTYYYRAYVRIKKGKNDLQYSYAGDKAANAAYGKVRKFTEEAKWITSANVSVECPDGSFDTVKELIFKVYLRCSAVSWGSDYSKINIRIEGKVYKTTLAQLKKGYTFEFNGQEMNGFYYINPKEYTLSLPIVISVSWDLPGGTWPYFLYDGTDTVVLDAVYQSGKPNVTFTSIDNNNYYNVQVDYKNLYWVSGYSYTTEHGTKVSAKLPENSSFNSSSPSSEGQIFVTYASSSSDIITFYYYITGEEWLEKEEQQKIQVSPSIKCTYDSYYGYFYVSLQ